MARAATYRVQVCYSTSPPQCYYLLMLATSRLNGTTIVGEILRLFLPSCFTNRSVICKLPFTMRKTRTLGATAAACLLRKVTTRHRLAGSCIVGFKTKAQGVTCP